MTAIAPLDLPKSWKQAPLKYVAEINAEKLDDDTNPDYRFRYIDISSVTEDGGIGEVEELRFEDAPSRARRVVRPGDVVVSTVRTYLRAIARVPESDEPLIASTGFATLRARDIDPQFLYWWTRSAPFIEEIVGRSVGVSYPAVNPAEVGRINTPLPALSEQRAIADFLDRETTRIDTLITKKRELIASLQDRIQSVQDGWVDAAAQRFGAVPMKRLVDVIDQGWSPATEQVPADSDEWGVLKLSAVTGERFLPEENKLLRNPDGLQEKWILSRGDLLVTRGSGSLNLVGRACVAEFEHRKLIVPDLLYRIAPGASDPHFLGAVLNSRKSRGFIEGAVRTDVGQTLKIRTSDLAALPIPNAPPREQSQRWKSLQQANSSTGRALALLGRQVSLLGEHRLSLVTSATVGASTG